MSSTILTLFIFSTLFPLYESSRILGVFELNSKSHFQMFEALMKALAARGHEVVVVNHFPQRRPVPNYTDIDISGSLPVLVDNIDIKEYRTKFQELSLVKFLWEHTTTICKTILRHQSIQELSNTEKRFDAVITEIAGSECSAIFSFIFKAPLIGVVTCVPFPWIHGRLGNPDHPAYNPGYFVPYTSRMNFWQRLRNTFYNTVFIVGNHLFNNLPTNTLLKEYFGDNIPDIEEVAKNTSIILVNSHFSITEPRATVPGYIEVGGLHVHKPKPLPQDIKEFIDGSEHGVIYFSLGSLVQVQSFPPEKLQALVDAFAALPERVLMKYTGNQLPQKPDNIMIGKWFPQLDVLSHPKTKLFISHGGLMGSQESVYAGVPVLGIPLFADQELNVIRLAGLGMAVKLDYDQLSKDNILRSIRNVIDDQSYSENAKKVSALFRDRPMSAMETAVYWVEYVIRHRGAPHLRSAAADMPLYQYLLLDVVGVLLFITATCVFVVYFVLRTALKTIFNTKYKHPRGNEKRD